jgi:hypothetical protein
MILQPRAAWLIFGGSVAARRRDSLAKQVPAAAQG